MRLFTYSFTLALCLTALHAPAQEEISYATRHIDAVRATEPPKIDGILDDPAWNTASTVTKFYNRRTDGYSKQNTIARIMYDDEFIYVAFESFEDPDTIVANERKYDRTRIFSDDKVQVSFDTFHDKERMYMFTVTPLGTRLDARRGVYGFNISWDADWQAETKILEDRWIAEFAIPIGVMYLNKGENETWGINFYRDDNQSAENSRWNYDPKFNFSVKGYGEWRGLDLSNVKIQTAPEVETYVSSATNKEKGVGDASTRLSTGLDTTLRINSHWVTTFTVNPDFGQVEADSDTIQLRDTERFLPERRPFFNEGAELFRTPLRLYNSRRITDIEAGAKITGTGKNWTLAALDIQGESTSTGQGNFLVTRYTSNITEDFQLGGVLVNASGRDGDNTVIGLDTRLELSDTTTWTTQGTILEDKSHINDSPGSDFEKQSEHAWFTELRGGSKPLFWEFAYRDISENYSPDLGFISRRNIVGPSGSLEYEITDVDGPVQSYGAEAGFLFFENHNSRTILRDFYGSTNINFDNNLDFFVLRTENFHDPYDNHTNMIFAGYNMQNRYKSVNARYSWGVFQKTDFQQIGTRKPFRIGPRFTSEFVGDFRQEDPLVGEDRDIWLVRSVNEYTFNWEGRIKLTLEESSAERYNRTLLFAYEDIGDWDLYFVLNDTKDGYGIINHGFFTKLVYRW